MGVGTDLEGGPLRRAGGSGAAGQGDDQGARDSAPAVASRHERDPGTLRMEQTRSPPIRGAGQDTRDSAQRNRQATAPAVAGRRERSGFP